GLPSNAVSGITADEQGRIWALSGERIVEWNGRGFQPASVPASLRFLTPEWTTDVFWAIDGRRMARFSRGVLTTHDLPGDLIDLGTLGGPGSAAKFVNDAGTIVGTSDRPGHQGQQAFVWTAAD